MSKVIYPKTYKLKIVIIACVCTSASVGFSYAWPSQQLSTQNMMRIIAQKEITILKIFTRAHKIIEQEAQCARLTCGTHQKLGVFYTHAHERNTMYIYVYSLYSPKLPLTLVWLPTNLDHVHAGKATMSNKCSTLKDMRATYNLISPTLNVLVNLIPL